MIIENKLLILDNLLLKGKYQEIMKKVDKTIIHEIWYLLEALLQLGETSKSEKILQDWKSNAQTHLDKGLWLFYKSRCFLEYGNYSKTNEYLLNALKELENKKQDHKKQIYRINIELGRSYWLQGKTADALELLMDMKSKPEIFSEPFTKALTMQNIGIINEIQGKLSEALDWLNKALEIHRINDNKLFIGKTLNNIALVRHEKGELDKALKILKEAITFLKKAGNPSELAHALTNTGLIYHDKGKLKLALGYHQDALNLREQAENLSEVAASLNNIGLIFHDQGRLIKALEIFQRALQLDKKSGSQLGEASDLNNIGNIFYSQGKLQKALETQEKALKLWKTMDNPAAIAETIFNIVRLNFQLNNNHDFLTIRDQFPNPTKEHTEIIRFQNMTEAIILENKGKWDEAEKKWLNASQFNVEYFYQLINIEHLAKISLHKWKNKPSKNFLNELRSRLDHFESLCKQNQLLISLCVVYLLRGKFAQTILDGKQAEKYYNLCHEIALEAGLPLHAKLAKKELDNLKPFLVSLQKIEKATITAEDYNITEFISYVNEITELIVAQEESKLDN
ncbi:MAG: tetratricopeptide repeat protein [Candidatus Hodarchaeales archaeon]|jgi:tetratricopeptide (TPR) repeat protein